MCYGMGGFGGAFPWMGLVGMGVGLLFWISLIVLVVWVVRTWLARSSGGSQALDILNRRLAAGEINQTDYEQLRRTLGA